MFYAENEQSQLLDEWLDASSGKGITTRATKLASGMRIARHRGHDLTDEAGMSMHPKARRRR
jgi:hypothetical protein